ncbi:MAG: hypothetical protein EBR23_14845, partial [Planctomycetia bacterium]|nr:hypothetical protein [Planctomycetia bacterium]
GTSSTILLVTTGSGTIAVNAALDAGLNDGDVYLTSAGSITGSGLITGYTGSLVAQTGLAANANVSQGFSTISSAAGDISVANVWGIAVPNAITTTGNVSLTAGQDIALTNAITASGKTVTLTANGGGIEGGSLVTANTVDLNATAGIGSTSAVNLAAFFVSADTTSGAIDINNMSGTAVSVTSLTTTGGAAITFDQTGAGGIGLDGNVTSTTGTVTISSQQGISRTSGTITAGRVDLDAATGIGTATALKLAASTISADSTAGMINLANALGTAVTVTSLTTKSTVDPGGDLITFSQSGGGTVTFNGVSSAGSDPGYGAIKLTNAGGGITIASSGVSTAGTSSTILLVTTGSGTIAVNAALDAGLNDGDVY